MPKKQGYKANRKPWSQIEREFAECRRKKWFEKQERDNLKRIKQGLEPLPIEPYPTFAKITPELLRELARQTEEYVKSQEQAQALNTQTDTNNSVNGEDTNNNEH